MNLSEIRTKFIQQSGRYDLANSDGSDNGADFYINAGQKYLDRIVERHDDVARAFMLVEPGQYLATFSNCRAIYDVAMYVDGNFTWLTEKDIYELRRIYSKPFSLVSQGTPNYYSPAHIRPSSYDPERMDGIAEYIDIPSTWKSINSVILMPTPDKQYHVEVWGKFYSQPLVADSDSSLWSENFGYILIMAAQRTLEMFYRNSQGVNDWTAAIQSEVLGIEKDYIEELHHDDNQMEG